MPGHPQEGLRSFIEDEELMFDENGLGDSGTETAGPQKPGEGGKDMDENDQNVGHVGIIARPGFDGVYVPN